MSENKEPQEISGREKLKNFESSGNFVFHGSPILIEGNLEPRQATNFEGGKNVKHGKPAVVATPLADVAIFRAIMHPESHAFGITEDGKLHFDVTKEVLEKVRDKTGFVYVLNKQDFESFEGSPMEVRSQKEEMPREVVEVKFEDLPEDITIIENVE